MPDLTIRDYPTTGGNWKYRPTLTFSELVGKNARAVKYALEQVALDQYDGMLRKVPVKTGALRDSIAFKAVGGVNPRIDWSTIFYGAYQDDEPGHRPFMGIVLRQKQWAKKVASYIRAYMQIRKTRKR